jgi:hypothetical protein
MPIPQTYAAIGPLSIERAKKAVRRTRSGDFLCRCLFFFDTDASLEDYDANRSTG